jgi:hypothetical protein
LKLDAYKWIWVQGDRRGRPRCRCDRCGDEYIVNVPIDINIFGAVLEAFGKNHRNCKRRAPPAAGSPPVDHAIAQSKRRRKAAPPSGR